MNELQQSVSRHRTGEKKQGDDLSTSIGSILNVGETSGEGSIPVHEEKTKESVQTPIERELNIEQKEKAIEESLQAMRDNHLPTPAFNGFFIKKLFPKFYEEFKKFVFKDIYDNLAGIGADDVIAGLLLYNPRMLYDFFDEQKIKLNILGEGEFWNSTISDEDIYPTRYEAELRAFRDGMSIINSK